MVGLGLHLGGFAAKVAEVIVIASYLNIFCEATPNIRKKVSKIILPNLFFR